MIHDDAVQKQYCGIEDADGGGLMGWVGAVVVHETLWLLNVGGRNGA